MYSLVATIVDGTGARVNSAAGGQDTQALTIDSSGSTKQPNNGTDENATTSVVVSIDSIVNSTLDSKDTGVSATDFVTSDQTLNYSGSIAGWTPNGDVLRLELKNSDGTVAATKFVTPAATAAGAGMTRA